MRLSLLLAMTGLGLVTPLTQARAETPELARLDGFAQGLTLADRFSGAVLVAKEGEIRFERAYGKRDEAGEELLTPATRFNIASAGKMFTAVAVLQQVAAGRLTLDTPIGAVLPGFRSKAARETVTVRHLLTHTDGLGGIDELFGAENAAARAALTTHAAMVAAHDDRDPKFPPGSQVAYDNFGMVVLGRMVEVTSRQDYYSYVRAHIFDPSGMDRTDYAACADSNGDVARGYATVDGKRVSNCRTNPEHGFAAGGAMSTARDLLKFVSALRAGKLLPKALLADATRTHRDYMGLGFFATGYGGENLPRDFRWGHGGSSDGICADLRHYPRTGETVIVLSNRDAPSCFPVANFLHDQVRARR
jgi:CubicO group peptidase (beta-lactamase class C family)